MKFGVVSDLHLHAWPYGDPGDRLANGIESLRFALDRLSQEGADFVAVTGDVFHTPGRISTTVLNATYETFKYHRHLKFVFVPGNHDQTFRHQEESALCVLEPFGPVLTFEKPAVDFTNGIRVCGLPYTEDEDRIRSFLDRWESGWVVLMHQGVKSVEVGSAGFVLNEGLDPEWIPDTVHSLFTGHYHSHRRFSLRGTIPGALHQHNFGDVDDPRGFLVVEGERDPRITQIETRAYRFRDIEFEDITQTLTLAEAYRGDFVRVKNVPYALVSEVQRELLARKLWPADPMVVPAARTHTRVETGAGAEINVREVFERYVADAKVPSADADFGREILNAAAV